MSNFFESPSRGDDGADVTRGLKRTFWGRALASWFDIVGTGESTFVSPGLPASWRRTDDAFRDACRLFDLDADSRVIETVRLRALGGDHLALGLSFRASRGFARPVDVSARPCETEALPPEVAAAMIEAGLAAINAYSG